MKLRIRDLREDHDLSQKDVADILHIHQTTYSDYELGNLNIPLTVLHALADYYETQHRINKSVKNALIFPSTLILMMLLKEHR